MNKYSPGRLSRASCRGGLPFLHQAREILRRSSKVVKGCGGLHVGLRGHISIEWQGDVVVENKQHDCCCLFLLHAISLQTSRRPCHSLNTVHESSINHGVYALNSVYNWTQDKVWTFKFPRPEFDPGRPWNAWRPMTCQFLLLHPLPLLIVLSVRSNLCRNTRAGKSRQSRLVDAIPFFRA